MKTTNYSTTINLSKITALVFENATESVKTEVFTLPYEVDVKSALKALSKALCETHNVLKIKGVEVIPTLCDCPVNVIEANAKHLTERGAEGRTREPVFTRTLISSIITALVFENATESVKTEVFTLPYEVDAKNALKALSKALCETHNVLKIKGVETKSEVLEIRLARFYELSLKHGTQRVLTADELKARSQAREKAKAERTAPANSESTNK